MQQKTKAVHQKADRPASPAPKKTAEPGCNQPVSEGPASAKQSNIDPESTMAISLHSTTFSVDDDLVGVGALFDV